MTRLDIENDLVEDKVVQDVEKEDDDGTECEDLPFIENVGSDLSNYAKMSANIAAACLEFRLRDENKKTCNVSTLWMKSLITMLGVNVWDAEIKPLNAGKLTSQAKSFLTAIGIEPPRRVVDIADIGETCEAFAKKHGAAIPSLTPEEAAAWALPVNKRKRTRKAESADEPPPRAPAKKPRRANGAAESILLRLAALESRVASLESGGE